MTLSEYAAMIGWRWARGLDPTSTVDGCSHGLRLRVLPALGHLPVAKITAGLIDRVIDGWEERYGASTIKNSVVPLTRVLDEAVRDGLIQVNPARNRARRSLGRNALGLPDAARSPRSYAIPDMPTLERLAEACGRVHRSYADFMMLAALLAARSSEVAGLRAGDADFARRVVVISRQTFPGAGGLVTKQTKSRKVRTVPILDALEPVLRRLAAGKAPEARLLVGPRGGVLTTATVRDATDWDATVAALGLPELTRHGLRHTGATWMADAGVPLHVLQKILGHASIETTRGYLHPDDRHLASAAEQANAFLARSADAPVRPGRRAGARRAAASGAPAPSALAPPSQFGAAPSVPANHGQTIGL
ncbi:MAG: site-specific integrase [Bifidobacteriaceae bacterium]|nr:site-specific integrase [Bifidobacteriaceae bacterium]